MNAQGELPGDRGRHRLAQMDSGDTAGVSASEHGRAQTMIAQLQARVVELEEELATARARIAELETTGTPE